MRTPDPRNEDGASLVMVLVFTSVFALIVAGLLTEASASVRYTTNVSAHEKLVYAADAGVSVGIQQLQQNNELCPGAGLGSGPAISDVTVSGTTVSVGCSTTSGSTFGADGFAVVTTATGADSLKFSNAQPKNIKGPVFVSGTVNWGPGLQQTGGNFYQLKPAAGSCQTAPTTSQLSISAPYGYSCRSLADFQLPAAQSWPDPAHNPPAMPTAIPSPTGTDVAGTNCRVFQPGVYTTPPVLRKGDNYFASGTYYFNFSGVWNVKQATIYGGQPDANQTRGFLPAPSCATNPVGETGTGVEWIFGGTSHMFIDTQGAVELFARTGEPGSATSRVSLVGVPNEAGWTSAPYGYSANTLPAGTPLVEIKDGNKQDLAVHGLLYAPNQDVILTATNSVLAQTLGGMVVSHLTMQSSASAQGLSASAQPGTPQPRQVMITATAHGGTGQRDVVSTAVVGIANDAGKTVTVKGWRTRGPSDLT